MIPFNFVCRRVLLVPAVLFVTCHVAPGQTPVTQLRSPHKHLALDARLWAETEGVRLVPGGVKKCPRNPLFQADKPWEVALTNLYPNLIYDEEERLYKLWYRANLPGEKAWSRMSPPGPSMHDVGFFLCYATSRDGIVWEKPELGLFGFDGSKENNVVLRDCHNCGVFKDPHDPDPQRRYKLVHMSAAWKPVVRFSPDGLHWSEASPCEGIDRDVPYRMADTHNNAFWDARREKYVMITRWYAGERLVARAESEDFLHWEPSTLALRSTEEEGKAHQTYCMPAFPYANVYLGFVMMYHAGTDRSVDCELTWSPDSVTWHRVAPGVPFIPRGPAGGYDAGCIYAQAGSPTLVDGRIRIYYGGSTPVHRGWERNCLPCLATIRPDGFAAYEPADANTPGVLDTRPLTATGEPLRISADAAGGSVRVEVVGEPGYTLADCTPITTDVTDTPVRWSGEKGLSELKGRPVQLRFELKSAKLYALSGVDRQ